MTPPQFKDSLEQEVRQYILPYWMYKACDMQSGGYWGRITADGQVNRAAAKGAILHGRIMWAFSAAYGVFNDKALISHAQRTREFITQNMLQADNGRMGWHSKNLTAFTSIEDECIAQAYWLYALSEFDKHTNDGQCSEPTLKAWQELLKLFSGKTFDASPSETGYTWRTWLHIIEALDNFAGLSFRHDAVKVLGNLLDNALALLEQHQGLQLSIPQRCASAWLLMKWVSNWQPLNKPIATEIACALVDSAIQDGLKNEGGFVVDAQDQHQYGWVQAEAMLACWRCYIATNDNKYLQQVLKSWEFIQLYISDHSFGEWYWKRDAESPAEDEKAGFWKCPYHNSRACLEIYNDLSNLDIKQWKQ